MSWHDFYEAVVKALNDFQFFIAGLLGATVVTRYHKERLKNVWDYAVFILSGAITAHYLTQVVIHLFKLEPIHAGGVGFLLGAFGGMIIQELTTWIKTGAYKEQNFFSYFADIVKDWLNRGKK